MSSGEWGQVGTHSGTDELRSSTPAAPAETCAEVPRQIITVRCKESQMYHINSHHMWSYLHIVVTFVKIATHIHKSSQLQVSDAGSGWPRWNGGIRHHSQHLKVQRSIEGSSSRQNQGKNGKDGKVSGIWIKWHVMACSLCASWCKCLNIWRYLKHSEAVMSINGQKLSGSWVTTEPKGMPGAVEAPIPWLLSVRSAQEFCPRASRQIRVLVKLLSSLWSVVTIYKKCKHEHSKPHLLVWYTRRFIR